MQKLTFGFMLSQRELLENQWRVEFGDQMGDGECASEFCPTFGFGCLQLLGV